MCITHEENVRRSTNAPTNDEFFFIVALMRKSDATAALTGMLRKHLHSQSHLNDHSTQQENFNGALEGRKEGRKLPAC